MYVHVAPFVLVVLIVLGWLLWLTFDRAHMADRCDQATDDADHALGRVLAVEHHIAESEPASDGRHAR